MMRWYVEIARHFVYLYRADQPTSMLLVESFNGFLEYHVLAHLFFGIFACDFDFFECFAIFIQDVFVESAFDVDYVHACHVN